LLRYSDISIFQNGGYRHLGFFLQFEKFNSRNRGPRGSNCVTVPNFMAIPQKVGEIWRFFDFSRWRPPLYWILKI